MWFDNFKDALKASFGHIYLPEEKGECFVCKKLTPWIDIDYQAYFCDSEECQRRACE